MKKSGFTLIELMIVVVILAILVAIALPSYAAYVRKNHEKLVLQKISQLSLGLEKEKSRNFSFKDFSETSATIKKNKSSTEVIYNITVQPTFQAWAIKGCVNSALDNASLYKNFAVNSKGSNCEWSDSGTCEIPPSCPVDWDEDKDEDEE